MNRGIPMHPLDWDQQQEQLSALLDGELGTTEQAALERHLPTCARCQQALAELRAVRQLLHAVPAPTLPRSFMLPDEGPVPVPLRERAQMRTPPAPSVAPRIARQLGGLAAAVGLALLLGSALLGQGAITSSPARSGANGAPATSSDRSTTQGPSSPQVSGGGDATPKATLETTGPFVTPIATPSASQGGGVIGKTETPTGDSTYQSTHSPTPHTTSTPPSHAIQSENRGTVATPVLPIAGTGLFLGGALLYLAGRIAGRRKPGQRAG